MNAINFTTKYRGSFTIEFAIIAVFMSMIIVFTADMVVKQSTEGMLDRMSYSAVSVIKERTQLYSSDSDSQVMTKQQVQEVDSIVEQSLTRTMANFDTSLYGAFYEEYVFSGRGKGQYIDFSVGGNGSDCQPEKRLTYQNALAFSPVTNESRRAPVFQVTLCYQTNNWFGQLVGGDYQWVRSNSIILGR